MNQSKILFCLSLVIIYSRSFPGHMAHQGNVVKDEIEGSRPGGYTQMTYSCSPPHSRGPGWAQHIGPSFRYVFCAWRRHALCVLFHGLSCGRNTVAYPDIPVPT